MVRIDIACGRSRDPRFLLPTSFALVTGWGGGKSFMMFQFCNGCSTSRLEWTEMAWMYEQQETIARILVDRVKISIRTSERV